MSTKKRSVYEFLAENADDDDAKRGGKKQRHTEQSTNELLYPPRHPTRPIASIPFQLPSQLLTFSYDAARNLEFTNSALRYYVEPPRNADLRYGYERWIKRPEEKGRLDGLLRAISKYRTKLNGNGMNGDAWLKDIAVVSWRGVMTKILTAPYEDRDGWEMNVMVVNGTIYFEEHLSEEALRKKEDMAPKHRLQSYYGYSFESYCTSSSPDGHEHSDSHPTGWGGDVDTNIQWCSVVKTKLGQDRLVIGGEVDCVRGRYTGQPDTFVELKTSMTIRGPHDEANFEKKLLKFYFQSFLLGVPEIMVGFRTPAGRIAQLQSFQTVQIPRLVRGKPGAWEPLVCLDWGQQFLQFIKTTIQPKSQDKLSVWRVKFTPGTGISIILLNQNDVEDVSVGEDRVGFLPKWYLDELHISEGSVTPSASTLDDPNSANNRVLKGQ